MCSSCPGLRATLHRAWCRGRILAVLYKCRQDRSLYVYKSNATPIVENHKTSNIQILYPSQQLQNYR